MKFSWVEEHDGFRLDCDGKPCAVVWSYACAGKREWEWEGKVKGFHHRVWGYGSASVAKGAAEKWVKARLR